MSHTVIPHQEIINRIAEKRRQAFIREQKKSDKEIWLVPAGLTIQVQIKIMKRFLKEENEDH